MKSFSMLVTLTVLVLFGRAVLAAELTIPVTGAQVITTPEGKAQIVLSMARPEVLDHVSLGEARLQLSSAIVAGGRERRMQILALRAPYSGGEPQVYEGIVSRLSIEEGSRAQVVDLGNLVRGVLHESTFYGLLVTTPGGVEGGFDEADAQALLSAFQGATLGISYRRIPPPPRSLP